MPNEFVAHLRSILAGKAAAPRQELIKGLFGALALVATGALLYADHADDLILKVIIGFAIAFFGLMALLIAWQLKNTDPLATQPDSENNSATASPITITFDETVLKTTHNGAEHEKVVWDDIAKIVVVIEDDFLPSPYWYIGNGKTGIRVPNDATGSKELLAEFARKLPGYDCDETYKAVIRAMCAMEGFFVIWERPSAHTKHHT